MSTDFPTAPLTSRFINQRAAAPWKSLSLRLTHRNPDTPGWSPEDELVRPLVLLLLLLDVLTQVNLRIAWKKAR